MYKKIVILMVILLVNSACAAKNSEELYAVGIKLLRDGNSNGAKIFFKNALEKDRNNLGARYQLARAYVAEGNYGLAEKEFQKVKRLNPNQHEINLDMAKVYNFLRKPDLAISHAEEHLKIRSDSAEAFEIIGIAYGSKQKPQEAEAFFIKALLKEPGRISVKLEHATLQILQGKTDQARLLLEEIMKNDPKNVRAHYLMADIEIFLGKKKQALALYKKLGEIAPTDQMAPYKAGLLYLDIENIALAETTAGELIKKFPGKAEGYRLKGMASYRKKDFPGAINELQKANKLQPSIAGEYVLGLSLYNQGQLESALSQFRQILNKAPSFHQARLLCGIILLRQNRLDDAISDMTKLIEADEKNPLAHNILGSVYMAKGMYEEGMKELNTATRLDPRLVEAHLKKGMYHLSQGKIAEVESDFTTAIKVAPEVLNTRLILSSFYLQQNNKAKALATLKEGLNGTKSDSVLYFGMARIMFADKKAPEAIRFLQEAKKSNPGQVDAYFTLAAYYAMSGYTDLALNEYSAILVKEPINAKAMLRMAALLESSNRESDALSWYLKAKGTGFPEAYQALARYYDKKGTVGKAVAILDEGIKNIPRPQSVSIMEQKGLLYLKDKQYKEALKTGDDIEPVEPERAYRLKAAIYLAMKKQPEAIQQAQRAIALKPDDSFGYQLLASVYQEQNKPELAIGELKKGLIRDGNNPQTALMLAGLYAKTGDHIQAMKTCDEIVRIQPDYAPSYFAQGTFLEAQGNKKEAVKKYRAALDASSNFVPALNNLATLYADGYGAMDEALRLAENAFALEPGNPGIMDTLGYALLKNGRHQEARKILEKADVLIPGNPTINYHLALVYRASGEKRQAVDRLSAALRSGKFTEFSQAKNLLAELH